MADVHWLGMKEITNSLIGFLPSGPVVKNAAQVIIASLLELFAVLTAYIHMLWVRTVDGQLEPRRCYSATLCYNTLPFPCISEHQSEELFDLAQQVLFQRELKEAHHLLDLAVERCYRSNPFESDEEHLFHLYEHMIATEESNS